MMAAGGPTMPSIADLGEVTGSVLVFGGPVSNLEATQAVLAKARDHAIPPERIVCTGDTVAYCADPEATADLIRRSGIHVVRGNCEDALAANAADCGCNFKMDSACDALAARWYRYAAARITAATRDWMATLPPAIRFRLAGRDLIAVHGAPSAMSRWVFPSTSVRDKAFEVAMAMADGVIAGHSGLPFVETIQGYLWLNAGSVGLPANDGTPRGWYAVLAPDDAGRIVATLSAFTYDHASASERMRANGLPEAYAQALETGLWPSLDILPGDERATVGNAIPAPQHLVWAADATETTAHTGAHEACSCCS